MPKSSRMLIAITSLSISLKYQIIVGMRKELISGMFTRGIIIGKMEESSMEIKMAIERAKKDGNWSIITNKPTSVVVSFINNANIEDETELDLYSEDLESELAELWDMLAEEMDSAKDKVISVEAYGFVKN